MPGLSRLALAALFAAAVSATAQSDATTEDAELDLDFEELANFDDLEALDALDDAEALGNLPPAPPARRQSFIETTEEPAWEAPPGFTLHRLPRPGDNAAPSPFADTTAERDTTGVMCKLVGWLPFAKSCSER